MIEQFSFHPESDIVAESEMKKLENKLRELIDNQNNLEARIKILEKDYRVL